MIPAEQWPILIVVAPLLAAFVINVAGLFNKRLCQPLTVIALAVSFYASIKVLVQVVHDGTIHYRLGGWPPPFGIEYVIDHLNALILVLIAGVSVLASVFAKRSIEEELPDKLAFFYTLYVLLVTGLLGMTITGDAFNLYVLMEITALTNYALIAVGRDRALFSSFNYVIIGTMGACFYLLGTGHLYIMTGSLNMGDLQNILPSLYNTNAILVAFILILVGIWIKMAFFPLHGWLPNAYSYAPSATSCLIAPLMTKVSVYIMIRIMFSVFTPAYVFSAFTAHSIIVWFAVIAIIAGSVMALSQKDFKKMLSYLIIAEVGYMVGGVWLANKSGIAGAILHIVNDAVMTLCLFLVAGIVFYKTKKTLIADMKGLYRTMPITMAAFTIGAFSMIGIPPTAGFFSKWYLIKGAIAAGQWGFMGALLFSSLVNAILFFRIIEVAYFEPMADHHGSHAPAIIIDEAPLSMLTPLVVAAVGLIVLGIYSGDIIVNIISFAVPAGM